MAKDLAPIARFPLPDEWEPVGTRCVIVRIPDDPQFLATFTGLLDLLKWSENFARDDTKTGAALVCRTWQVALEGQPIDWIGCEMPDFRINPETCLLEVDCSGEGTDWQPVFTPAYDPSQDAPVDPPYPDPPPVGQSNQCLAAANATAMLQNGAQNFSDLLGVDALLGTIVAFLYTFLSSVVTVTLSQLWLGLGVAYGAFDNVTFAADLAAFDWDELKCLLYDHYSEDGTMTGLAWAEVLDIMQDNVGESQIWLWQAMVWGLMGTVGAAFATHWANITEADCDDCEWVRIYQASDSAWSDITDDYFGNTPVTPGEFVPGTGWVTGDYISAGAFNKALTPKLTHTGMIPSYIKVHWVGATGANCTTYGLGRGYRDYTNSTWYWVTTNVNSTGFDEEHLWTGSGASTNDIIFMNGVNGSTELPMGGAGVITRIEIHGTGSAPNGGTP